MTRARYILSAIEPNPSGAGYQVMVMPTDGDGSTVIVNFSSQAEAEGWLETRVRQWLAMLNARPAKLGDDTG